MRVAEALLLHQNDIVEQCWKLDPTPTRTLAEIFKHWRLKLTNLLLSFISEFVQSKNYKFKVKINK